MADKKVNNGALYSLFLRLDFRDKRKSGFKKLVGVLIAYFFANTALSFGNFTNFDEVSFVILSMSTNAFFLSFILLNDFISLFLGKEDNEIIYSLPVSQENIFFSKFFAAYSFISFYAAAIVIPQVIFYYQYNESIGGTALFILCVFLFNVFIISLLAILYTIILSRFVKISHLFIYFVNVCFLLFVFYSSTIRAKALGDARHSLLNFGYVNYLPQALYAKGVSDPVMLFFLAGLTIFAALLCFYLLRMNFARISSNVASFNKRTKKKVSSPRGDLIAKFIDKPMISFFLRNHFQRAAYYLMKGQLANSRVFKMRYFIFMIMPLVFTAVAVFSGIKGTVVFKPDNMENITTGIAVISPTILFIYILCARLIVSNTRIADANSNDTEWIYDSLPVNGVSMIRLGVLKFILVYFLIPLMIIMGALMSIRMDILSIAFNLLYVTSGVFLISSVLYRFDKAYPFTLDSTKMDSASKFVEIILTIFLGILIFISQLFIFKNIIFIIVSIPVLLLAGGFILRTQKRQLKKAI